MEQLQIKTVDVTLNGKPITCTLVEKDFGDQIVYDVFHNDIYLCTISKQGEILFKEEEMNQEEIMDPRDLNEIIEQLRGEVQE